MSGWTLTWADEQYVEASLADGVSTAVVSFDQFGRFERLSAQLGGTQPESG